MFDKCFQYALTVALNYEQIKSHTGRISKIQPFLDQHNWKEIEFPSNSKDWKKFESNNKSIALNILYVSHNTEKIRHGYKSNHNLKRENQIILLVITGGEKWHYLAVQSLSALLRGITSNHKEEFYCFRSYTTKNRLKKHKNVRENHDYYYVQMSEEDGKIFTYNNSEKSMRVPFVICADLECLLEKLNTCHNDPEKSSTTKVNKQTSSGYSLFACSLFDTIENELDYHKVEDCMKKFCEDLKKHVTKITSYQKKEMIPFIKKKEKKHNKQKSVLYTKKDLVLMMTKVRDHCHYTGKYRDAAHNICNLRYKIPKEIPVVFHNGSTYAYRLIIKDLAK